MLAYAIPSGMLNSPVTKPETTSLPVGLPSPIRPARGAVTTWAGGRRTGGGRRSAPRRTSTTCLLGDEEHRGHRAALGRRSLALAHSQELTSQTSCPHRRQVLDQAPRPRP